MDQLSLVLRDCLSQFSGKFWLSDEIVAYSDRFEKTHEIKETNGKLKKAVKILYNRMIALKLERLDATEAIADNRRMAAALAQKDRQLAQMQVE